MYLIVGANGFVGSYFVKNILKMTNDKIVAIAKHNVSSVEHTRVEWLFGDICNLDFIHKINQKIKAEYNIKVIYLVGIAPPEAVFRDPRGSFNIDVVALANFVNLIENVGTLYYLSSEAVFSGGSEEYRFKDNDKAVPMNLYGCHKLAAEAIISAKGFNSVRFPVMIGKSLSPFKPHFFDIILAKLNNGEKVEMFTDSVRSITDFDTATQAVISLIENPETRRHPVVNIACDDALSKYELGIMIAEKYGFNRSLIVPASQFTSNVFEDKRESIHLLDNTLLKSLLGVEKLELKI